jgi:hypothetical protein
LEFPAHERDARRFRLMCTLVAAGIMTGWLALAVALGNKNGWWPRELPVHLDLMPAVILLDTVWGLIPLALGLIAASWACLEVYRGILMLGPRGEARHARRRRAVLGHYGAALWMVESVPFGILFLLNQEIEKYVIKHSVSSVWPVLAILVVGLVALGLHLWTSLGLVLRTGRWRAFRAVLMFIYPLVAYATWLVVLTAVNWAVGYLVLGVRSMTT